MATTMTTFGWRWLSAISCASLVGALANTGCSSGALVVGNETDASSGGDGAAGNDSGSTTDGATSCCPSGYLDINCTWPDGSPGVACHNRALGCASSLTCGQGCDQVSTTCGGGPGGGGAGEAGVADAGGTGLTWWWSCGDPVCRVDPDAGPDAGLTDDAGAPCPAIGSACSTDGERCGTHDSSFNCGSVEQCSATDPTTSPYSCPISSRKFKDNVRYVDDTQLEMLHDEALHIRLATYNYKAAFEDPTVRHLGFIVEDDPASPAVDRPYDRVDMYGYMSMLVATTQVQEKEIEELRHELEESRRAPGSESLSCPPPRK